MSITVYDFETGDTSRWDVVNVLSAVTDRVFAGTYAGYSQSGDTPGSVLASEVPADLSGGNQIGLFEYWWQETSGSHGAGIRLVNSNGDVEVGVATDNHEWDIDDGNGVEQVYGGDGYDRWVRYRLIFDWDNATFRAEFEDLQSGTLFESDWRPLKQGVDVETIQLENYNGGSWSTAGNSVEMWWDDITVDTTTYTGGHQRSGEVGADTLLEGDTSSHQRSGEVGADTLLEGDTSSHQRSGEVGIEVLLDRSGDPVVGRFALIGHVIDIGDAEPVGGTLALGGGAAEAIKVGYTLGSAVVNAEAQSGQDASITWGETPTGTRLDFEVFRRSPSTGERFDPVVDSDARIAQGIDALEHLDVDLPGDETTEVFTTDGTWTKPAGVDEVKVLVVAGGGGGGSGNIGGGGGAGGVVYDATFPVSGDQTVVVGGGGAINGGNAPGDDGGNSSFGTLSATGGGGGAADDAPNGRDGGSGGGAHGNTTATGGSGVSGEGFAGGDSDGGKGGGGGGGGSQRGQDGQSGSYPGGDGGDGEDHSAEFGTGVGDGGWFGGGAGGGGHAANDTSGGVGGQGGGGTGGGDNGSPTAGTAETGGGGGGGNDSGDGAPGGSGIVIVKYSTGDPVTYDWQVFARVERD